MMADHVSLSTRFYEDSYIQTLPPTDKFLYLYLISGPQCEPTLGIYELSLRTMAHHTGLTEANIRDSLNRFAQEDKIHHVDGWIVTKNHFKHNPLRGNKQLILGALKRFDMVPWSIRDRVMDENDALFIPHLCPINALFIGHSGANSTDSNGPSMAPSPVPSHSRPFTSQSLRPLSNGTPVDKRDEKMENNLKKAKERLVDRKRMQA